MLIKDNNKININNIIQINANTIINKILLFLNSNWNKINKIKFYL